jgi:galactokinase
MDLPLKKGVSSSAAVCILIAKAFDRYFDLKLFPHELMEMAYLGERLTGSQCGRMDQACIYGKTPVLLLFEKTKQTRLEPIFPGKALHLFFVDLGGEKDTVEILNDLQNHYLKSEPLQTALGRSNEQFVRQACQCIQGGDAKGLGELMTQAQTVFDRDVAAYSPRQLDSPLLHELLNYPAIRDHIFGGKGVGSQGDGTAQFVARDAEHRDAAIKAIEQAFSKMRCFPLTIRSANG